MAAMSLFDGPEYASYIALCRELGLPWKWQEGDWYWHPGDGLVAPFVGHCRDRWLNPDVAEKAVPLPRLDQWLAMLEEAGLAYVMFGRNNRDVDGPDGPDGRVYYCRPLDVLEKAGLIRPDPAVETFAPTREEACARLWMALTGRTVTSG